MGERPSYRFTIPDDDAKADIRRDRHADAQAVLQSDFDPISQLSDKYRQAWTKYAPRITLDEIKKEVLNQYLDEKLFYKDNERFSIDKDSKSRRSHFQHLLCKRFLAEVVVSECAERLTNPFHWKGSKKSLNGCNRRQLLAMKPQGMQVVLGIVAEHFPSSVYYLDFSAAHHEENMLELILNGYALCLREALDIIGEADAASSHPRSMSVSQYSSAGSASGRSGTSHSRQTSASTVATDISMHSGGEVEPGARKADSSQKQGIPYPSPRGRSPPGRK
ncbi:hypothetical protein SISNIDRAFT_485206 [Sistotremastrum niveocremeum HHB9708]|uniref:Uncharacterized protein n=1 Tax=Sistotremastrum niveocremeum HHB9708 TaxID=1314777 RepID=A0A164VMJ2_9AGAM|nr:hypothetical protein SISNIDRAFT_485206 [Sistotremastrum niveocremeum HHB9708]